MTRPYVRHHQTDTPEFRAFYNARRRCTDVKGKQWESYGGRGIKFLFTSFEQFIKHIGPRPTPKHRLDRKNNDGHYEVGNVRWVTRTISNVNTRTRTNNVTGFRGVSRHSVGNRFSAQVAGKYLGLFKTRVAAAHAYDAAALQQFGSRAKLNFSK